MYTTGNFRGTAYFDPNAANNHPLTSAWWDDIFISKWSTTGTLPITLLNFEATKKEYNTRLTWETGSELNTDKFEIERSDDGLNFKYIGEVKAAENSTTTRTYHFSDRNAGADFPNQDLYYRFKQMDLDGQYTYSPIRSVKFEDNLVGNDAQVQGYPNPAKDVITIQASIGLTYNITDQTGRQVLSGRLYS